MVYFLSDYIFAAKYPFSSKAKEIMREHSVEANDQIAEMGFERLKSALNGEIKKKIFIHEEDAIVEILSYAAARMILSYMRNRYLANRYAIAEAKKTFSYLSKESKENILSLARDVGINSFSEDQTLTVDVSDFLLYSPKDMHYKLIRRDLRQGRVRINQHEQIRLIEEAVKKYAEKIPESQSVPPAIKKVAEKLHTLLPKIEPQKISFKEGENPPCIEALLDVMKKHENVGHTGRWLLAVYLINRGMSTPDIVNIYSNAPDFNERISTYQIEHARKRGYKMPNCVSVFGYGYCVADCKITNPMNWKRSKTMLKKEEKSEDRAKKEKSEENG